MKDLINLTDDEVVALAHECSAAWPTQLPTVDVTRADDLARALLRGRRSLAARNLVTVSATDPDAPAELDASVAALARAVTSAAQITRLYLADDAGDQASFDLLSHYYHLPGGEWLVEAVDAGGLRRFSQFTDAEFRTLVSDLALLVHDRGIPGAAGHATTLCVATGDARLVSLVGVQKGSAWSETVTADGVSSRHPETLASALSFVS